MPELPEVETMVRGIRPHIEGREITAFRKCPCPCKPLTMKPGIPAMVKRSVGQTVTRVRRRAKRVVLELSSGEAFVIEPRMTGLVLVADPPDVGHLRVEWQFGGERDFNTLWFWDRRGLGTVRLYSAAELAQLLEAGHIGPDALEMTSADWETRCAATSRPIKVALLDQKLAAGIGNLYASEILHLAKIHPARPSDGLTRKQIAKMHEAVQEVLQQAIVMEGSTLGDGTYRNALNETGEYQNIHRVYQKHTEACPSCRRGTIERIVQAQRSTFFCPRCQK